MIIHKRVPFLASHNPLHPANSLPKEKKKNTHSLACSNCTRTHIKILSVLRLAVCRLDCHSAKVTKPDAVKNHFRPSGIACVPLLCVSAIMKQGRSWRSDWRGEGQACVHAHSRRWSSITHYWWLQTDLYWCIWILTFNAQ